MRVPWFSLLAKGVFVCLLVHHVKGSEDKGYATSDLTALQEAFFEWREEQAPEYSTEVGRTKVYNDRLTDLSLDVFDTDYAAIEQFIGNVSSIDRSLLDRRHQYSYDVFLDTLSTFGSNYVWRHYGALNPVSFLEAFYLDLNYIVDVNPFDTKEDFDNYIARLEAWPTQIEQMISRMNEAIRFGTTYHNVSVRAIPGQISDVISTPVRDSPLYRPFNATLDAMNMAQLDRDGLRSRAVTALQHLWTSLGNLKLYFENTYSHHTRGSFGVGGLPAGGNYYRACLQWHLSVDTPPSQVHNTGLREVERISGLMRQVMTEQGFNGTIGEYYRRLKSDPQFHLHSTKEILEAYKDLIYNRISPKLSQLFDDIPPNNIVVKPLPYDGPGGMYGPGSEDGSRPGTFYANVLRPNETNTFSMVSLTLHEAVPGHHLQSVYQMASRLPDFQKHIAYSNYYAIPYQFPFYTAYTEGWALYSEYLGEEMGVYANDYELMGRYGDEMFRACRLVVDTGIHFFGWSRNKAIDYIADRTPMSQSEVETEVDRYITWPGQACAYKIGELKIKELRQKAESVLGDRFDIHDFHTQLLTNGAVPLHVLETIVNDYIADRVSGGQPVG